MATQKQSTAVTPAQSTPPPVDEYSPGKTHGVIARIAARFGVDSEKMLETLKQTAFRQRPAKDGKPATLPVTNEQMMMLLVVADQYHLNPFTREIYAFPQDGGIVPIVSVDGWIRIINEHPQIESIEFDSAPSGTEDPWVSCTITRKDRSKPTTVIEYLSECYRKTDPWDQMPRRMLRHKSLIQCGRVAFGFAGIFDPDEADKIVATIEKGSAPAKRMKPETKEPQRIEKPARITPDQAIVLRDKCHEEGVEESLICARFEINAFEDIPADKYGLADQYIEDASA